MAQILVIDDEEDMRLTLSMILSQKGHVVKEASSARVAYERLEKEKFNLVLLDIRMPEIDGLQALKEIRKRGYNTPIIMITGYQNVESAVEAIRLGASEFLKKPFDNQQLVTAINRVLEKEKISQGDEFFGKRIVEKLSTQSTKPAQAIRSTGVAGQMTTQKRRSAEWVKNRVVVSLSLGILFAGAVMFWQVLSKSQKNFQSFAIPFKNVAALSWHEEHLWIADWFTHTIYKTKVDVNKLVIVKSYYLPSLQIVAFCFIGDYLYSCDQFQKAILKHELDNWLTVIETVPYPGLDPSALFWDGKSLWSSDSGSAKIYKHGPAPNFSILSSYSSPGGTPAGIHINDQYLWSIDGETRKIYQHQLDDSLTVLKGYNTFNLLEGEEPLSAFTISDNKIWLAKEGKNQIYQFSKNQLK